MLRLSALPDYRLLLRSGVELGVEYTTNIDQSNAYVGSLRLGLRVPF